MRVTVEFYGVLRQVMGGERTSLELPGATVAEALEQLCRQQPRLTEQLPRVACAVGSNLVRREDALSEGCTLALIPPVSGGCR
ncbi:MAG: MoaD/ThiS family protein [Nevskiales bacterium]